MERQSGRTTGRVAGRENEEVDGVMGLCGRAHACQPDKSDEERWSRWQQQAKDGGRGLQRRSVGWSGSRW